MYRIVILLFFVLQITPYLRAQSTSVPQEDAIPPLPATVNGDTVPNTQIPEMQRNRQWFGHVRFETECNDNALASVSSPASDCTNVVTPSVLFQQVGYRSSWNVSYAANFAKHYRFSALDEIAQSAGLEVQHRFTRRLSARVREAFVKTTGFGSSSDTSDLPSFGLMQHPNDFAITPAIPHFSNTTAAESIYQIGGSSFVGVTGSYTAVRYETGPATSFSLTDSDTGTAGALYSRQLGRRNWVGMTYDWQRIAWGGSQSTTTDSFLYTHSFVLSRRLMISGFVGPQYWSTQLPLINLSQTNWSVAAGATLGWANEANRVEASAVRRVSDGGGLIGAAELNQVSGSVTRQLSRKWAAWVSSYYADSAALSTASEVHTFSSSAGLEYRVQRSFLATLQYGREWQEGTGIATAGVLTRNRLALTLRYTFGGQLGR